MTNLEIQNAYIGNTDVEKIYLGNTVIYQEGPQPEPVYSAMPLTFEIISGGTLYWKAQYTSYTTTIEYSRDNGSTWTSITSNTGESAPSISVDAGDIIQFRGYNDSYSSGNSRYNNFSGSSAYYKAYGNIMSLFDGDSFDSLDSFPAGSTHNLRRFFQNANVVDAENLVLPATALTSYCYSGMFSGCGSLTKVPSILPATILNDHSCYYMFENCTSLTTAPELPATRLATYCYTGMFKGCTNLTTAPSILPVTALADYCYQYMFNNCTSLTTAPELPATALTRDCYYAMFNGCSRLMRAPELPAPTLVEGCYANMFTNCSNLNYIKCLATDISASNSTLIWVADVAYSGTFVKNPYMSGWTIGFRGIPTNWTVQNADIPYIYVQDDYGSVHYPIAIENGQYSFLINLQIDITWTLYNNGSAVTASSFDFIVNHDEASNPEEIEQENYVVQNMNLGAADCWECVEQHEGSGQEIEINYNVNTGVLTGSVDFICVDCLTPEEECALQGGCWDFETTTCVDCDPCQGDPACECERNGGVWDYEIEDCIYP